MKREDDAALALMVYETWLLNGATEECMPSLRLRKWCNRTLKRHLFPLPSASVEKAEARGRHTRGRGQA